MSIETVNQFLTKVSEDKELQAEVTQALEAEDKSQAITKIAAKHGYDFTPEELSSQFDRVMEAQQQNELSEAELEAVAGGATITVTPATTLTKPIVEKVTSGW